MTFRLVTVDKFYRAVNIREAKALSSKLVEKAVAG